MGDLVHLGERPRAEGAAHLVELVEGRAGRGLVELELRRGLQVANADPRDGPGGGDLWCVRSELPEIERDHRTTKNGGSAFDD